MADDVMMTSQRTRLYQAEELAGESWCSDPAMNRGAAQALAEEAVTWATSTLGIKANLSVTVDEHVIEGTASEIYALWDEGLRAAEVDFRWRPDGSAESCVNIYTAVATDTGVRVGATAHLMLHELAHVIVGPWPQVGLDGKWSIGPDRHGALFARRHLDLVERFHPADCLAAFEDAYREFGIEVASPDVDPASLWDLPRPTVGELIASGLIQSPDHRWAHPSITATGKTRRRPDLRGGGRA